MKKAKEHEMGHVEIGARACEEACSAWKSAAEGEYCGSTPQEAADKADKAKKKAEDNKEKEWEEGEEDSERYDEETDHGGLSWPP